MPSRALYYVVPSSGLLLFIAILVLMTPDKRPLRETFETLCERGIRSSPTIIRGQAVRAVTFNYNTKGGNRPARANFGAFSVGFDKNSTIVSGYCRSNSTGTDVILSELRSVRF